MTLFRRTLIAATAAAALATPFAASWAQDIKPRIIRFGYGLNEISNQGRATKLFAEEVEKASGGKMKVRAIGLVTPPVGTVLNVVAGVGRLPMHQVIKGVNPFLITYLIVLGLFIVFPQIVIAPVAWMR